jgi:lysophospholipase L1-like esterase
LPALLLAAGAAVSWFGFWTHDATVHAPVVHARVTTACHAGVHHVTVFGAPVEHLRDGSVIARNRLPSEPTEPFFAFFTARGRFRVCLRAGSALVRVRVDGRVADSFRAHGAFAVAGRLRGTHRIGLELGGGIRLLSVTGSVTPDPLPGSAPLAIFLGDSYTLGAGGDAPTGYAYRAGWAQNWNVRVDALGGTGFLNRIGKGTYGDRLGSVLAQRPRIVVVAGGINDYGNFPNDKIAAAANAVFARVEASGARLVVLSPWEPPDRQVAGYRDLVARIAAAAKAHHARYIDTSSWLTPRLMSGDRIHPNEHGYRTIAAKLALRL